MSAMKGVLKPLIDSGSLSDSNITLEQARLEVLKTIRGNGKTEKDKQQIAQMVREVERLPSLELVQKYVFNSYLKFNGLGVI